MKFSRRWLQEYFDAPLPSVDVLATRITMHAFELEGIEEHGEDVVLDIKVLPNRAHDCFSYYGMARELGALLTLPVHISEAHPKTDDTLSTKEALTLSVENTVLVPRAMKRYVEGVTIGESPAWLKEKLAAHGQRSINNVVDATNLVMFETGQPVHIFDYDTLAGGGVKALHIRSAKEGEKLVTLDDRELILDESVLVISDAEKALDIAGIKGGKNSGVSAQTTRLVLSACNFNPVRIRKTSKKLGLRTDASVRFENGIAPELVAVAMARLSELVVELAGGRVASDIAESYPRPKNPFKVGVSLAEVSMTLGTEVSGSEIEEVFGRLGFSFEKVLPRARAVEAATALVGTPYVLGASVLADAPRAFDCSSLVSYVCTLAGLRIPRMSVDQFVFGYEVNVEEAIPGDLVFSNTGEGNIHFESKEFMKGTPVPQGVDHVGIFLGDGTVVHASRKNSEGVAVEDLTTSASFTNIVGYRRVIANDDERYVVTVPAPRLDIRIKEDLIEEIGRLKGLENIPSAPLPPREGHIQANAREQYKAVIRETLVSLGYSEVYTYTFREKGSVELANPLAEDKRYLRASLVDGVTSAFVSNSTMLPLLGLSNDSELKLFEIGTVFATGGQEHCELALVSKKPKDREEAIQKLSEVLGVDVIARAESLVTTVDCSQLFASLPDVTAYSSMRSLPKRAFVPLSPYPFVLRDIAVWTPATTAVSDVEKSIKTEAGGLLARVTLFDEYKKEDNVSYAFHLVFQSPEKTLSDADVEEPMRRITEAFSSNGWTVR